MRASTVVLLSLLLLPAAPARAKSPSGGRKALVIGVADYSGAWTKLTNPIRDAQAMERKLTAMGYSVRRLTDPTGDQMDAAASEFTRTLRDGDTVVFFYAGHGVQVDSANYLIPKDFTSDSEDLVKHRAFPLAAVVDAIERNERITGLVIVDACRTNGLKPSGRGIRTRGLSAMPEAHGVLIAFAASANQEAEDGTSENGLYTGVLLKHIDEPNIQVEEMLRIVGKEVYQASGRRQTPAKYGNILDDFCLVGDKCGGSTAATPAREEVVPATAPPTAKREEKSSYCTTDADCADPTACGGAGAYCRLTDHVCSCGCTENFGCATRCCTTHSSSKHGVCDWDTCCTPTAPAQCEPAVNHALAVRPADMVSCSVDSDCSPLGVNCGGAGAFCRLTDHVCSCGCADNTGCGTKCCTTHSSTKHGVCDWDSCCAANPLAQCRQ
jgi:hypothetical protein